jgi:hypothetical protein
VSGEASKYVPDDLRSVQDLLASAKASLEHGDYQAAVTGAQQIPGKVAALQTALAAKKAELTKAWDSMGGVSQMIDAVKARVTELSGAKKLPSGVSTEAVAEAKGSLAGLTQVWAEASTAAQSGDMAQAVAKASTLREQVAKIMAALRMPALDAAK